MTKDDDILDAKNTKDLSNDGFAALGRVMTTLSNDGFLKGLDLIPDNWGYLKTLLWYRYGVDGGRFFPRRWECDAAKFLVETNRGDILLFFTNAGRVFSLPCHKVPLIDSRRFRGTAITDFFSIADGETVTAPVPLKEPNPKSLLLMATRKGEVKKIIPDQEFLGVEPDKGIIAMHLQEGDELVDAALATDQDEIILVTAEGHCIRFAVNSMHTGLPASSGEIGISLNPDDKLVGLSIVILETHLLVVTVNGYGKLVPVESYKQQSRGGPGIKTQRTTEKDGKVFTAHLVSQSQQLMLASKKGICISAPLKNAEGWNIPVLGRTAQGVALMKTLMNIQEGVHIEMEEGDQIVSAVIMWSDTM